jgi:hypothetical protein
VPEILKMLELANDDGVAQVEIGRRGIKANFHAQRPAGTGIIGETFSKVFFANELREAFL